MGPAQRRGLPLAALLSALLLAAPSAPVRAVAADPAATPQAPLLASPDSPPPDTAASAPVEAVNLAVEGRFTAAAPRAGDSLDYVLKVEWADAGVPVVVLAPDSLDFQGFDILGQATHHKKVADARGVRNRTEFVYRLRATTPGSGRAAPLKLRYLSGISRSEESVFVPASRLDIAPAPTRFVQTLWFRFLAGLLVLAMGAMAVRAAFAAARRRAAAPERGPAGADLEPEVLALKSRLKGGESRDILLQMESLCARHLQARLEPAGRNGKDEKAGGAGAAAASPAPRFDALLDRHLAGNGGDRAEDWKALRDLFQHARFAGGHKEPHELQDAYRTLKRCLEITNDPGEA